MAGQDPSLLFGSTGQPSLTEMSAGMGRNVASGPSPHYSVIAVVLLAVLGLWALDKFGFRFAVTAGRR